MCNFFPRGTLAGTDSADVFNGHEQDLPISMFWSTTGRARVPSSTVTRTRRCSSCTPVKLASSSTPRR